MMQKIKNIEFLRIIFMLSILWLHLSRRIIDILNNDTFTYFAKHSMNGNKAVEGFFILSGFLLVITFTNSTSITDFVKKKIIRLTPVLIFASIIAAIAGFFKIMQFSLPAAIFNITFTLVIVGKETLKNWNSIAITWYISAMFWVLLLYFSIIKIFTKKYANFLIGICTVSAWFLVLHLNHGSLFAPYKMFYHIFNVGFLRALGAIGIGYFIGEWYKNNLDEIQSTILSPKQKLLYSFFELAFLIICILELFILNSQHCYNFSIVIYLTILIWLFVQQKGYISCFFNRNWCERLGRYSYSIYVLHLLLYDILRNSGFISYCGKLSYIPVFLLPIIFGILTYHFIEKPCADYFKKNNLKLKNNGKNV